jgi:hypothetical protein
MIPLRSAARVLNHLFRWLAPAGLYLAAAWGHPQAFMLLTEIG